MTQQLDHAARLQRAEAWVRHQVAGHDSSHDVFHIQRVAALAARLAAEEGLPPAERQLAELAAWVHESMDHKYSTDPDADRQRLLAFLSQDLQLGEAEQAAVVWTVDSMGFKEELARRQQPQQPANAAQAAPAAAGDQQGDGQPGGLCRERLLAVVQDADRLDAIGAIGIARCLTFGGRFGRVLHDPAIPPRQGLTREQYADKAAAAQQTTLNHFHEKLLLLQARWWTAACDLMRTAAGRRLAEGRHAFMQEFLQRFHEEWRAAA